MNNNYNNSNYNNSLRKEIVEKVDIVQVIGSYVTLTKKGANYIGLCPFHQDTNPSMSVSPTKKVFKCFSCNTGGDVITFVSKFKNITQMQAMRELGASVGITFQLTKKEIERQKNDKYYKITKEASSFYSFYLNDIEEANEARLYLKNRGLSQEVIDRFHIGCSSDNDELYKVLIKKDFLPLDMIEVNLIRSYGDTYHDVFKNRIIFPLEDLDGNVVGFSGRRYKQNDNDAKYINTTDTVIFKKGNILYNYHNAISKIKEKDCVYLFEGFMDVIAACRCGVENSVASMGTALTQNQILAIKRLTNNIVVGYDSDGPGVMATLKAIDMLILEGFNIKVARIPDGKDPDEYIFKNGNEALYDVLNNKLIAGIDFIYDYYSKYLLKEDVNSVDSFKNNVYQAINKFNSLTITETYLKKLSNDINISLESLKNDFEIYKNNNKITIKPVQNYNFEPGSTVDFLPYDESFLDYAPIDEVGYMDTPQIFTQSETPVSIKINDNFEARKKKYVTSEEMLLVVAYNEKNKCLEIKNKLNNNCVLKLNRDILLKIYEYYTEFEVIDENMLFEKLGDNESNHLRSLLKKHKLPESVPIDVCIENVKAWPYEDVIHNLSKGVLDKEKVFEMIKYKKENFKPLSKNKKIIDDEEED